MKTLDLSPRLQAALASLEWPDCKCNLMLMSVCLVGVEPRCRERKKSGECSCPLKWLPLCLHFAPHGCAKRRLGKKCMHPLHQLPRCLANGCADRQRGHLCDCPRGPSARCPHMGHDAQMRLLAGFLAIQKLCPPGMDPYDLWAWILWRRDPKTYADRELPGAPRDMSNRDTALKTMMLRHALGVALRHPQDRHAPIGEEDNGRRLLQLRSFALLIGPRKGGDRHDDTAA